LEVALELIQEMKKILFFFDCIVAGVHLYKKSSTVLKKVCQEYVIFSTNTCLQSPRSSGWASIKCSATRVFR